MRWLYHLATTPPPEGDYAPASLGTEGFVHCSYKPAVAESAKLYFKPDQALHVYRIDPRRLTARLEDAPTPRGPMPHVHGAIERDAIVESLPLAALESRADELRGTRFAIVAFPAMTLLDLVGVYDPLSRLETMGLDPTSRCEIVGGVDATGWESHGARLQVSRVRPDLRDFDVLVLPGGLGARTLVKDEAFVAWLRTFPANRLALSVCTGALLLGAMGRLEGKRATTHASALGDLSTFGASPVRERVVRDGQTVTAAGVTAGIDGGLCLVGELMGREVLQKVAAQMEHAYQGP